MVSNKTGPVLRREAAHLGWTGYFARLVGAGDAAADKPDAAPVDLALDGSGIVCGDAVWYVGDTAIDMECAANAGCVGVLLGALDQADAGLRALSAGAAFSRLRRARRATSGACDFPSPPNFAMNVERATVSPLVLLAPTGAACLPIVRRIQRHRRAGLNRRRGYDRA